MQTFLPYASYGKTARCLDPLRLGNQCWREVKTLVNGGWKNHPASKMWRGYEYELCRYGMFLALAIETPAGEKWYKYYRELKKQFPNTGKPLWIGNKKFHDSHKSNLLRKDFEWYSQFSWDVPDDLPYYWPV